MKNTAKQRKEIISVYFPLLWIFFSCSYLWNYLFDFDSFFANCSSINVKKKTKNMIYPIWDLFFLIASWSRRCVFSEIEIIIKYAPTRLDTNVDWIHCQDITMLFFFLVIIMFTPTQFNLANFPKLTSDVCKKMTFSSKFIILLVVKCKYDMNRWGNDEITGRFFFVCIELLRNYDFCVFDLQSGLQRIECALVYMAIYMEAAEARTCTY